MKSISRQSPSARCFDKLSNHRLVVLGDIRNHRIQLFITHVFPVENCRPLLCTGAARSISAAIYPQKNEYPTPNKEDIIASKKQIKKYFKKSERKNITLLYYYLKAIETGLIKYNQLNKTAIRRI